jgi:hypothetical protein
MGFLEAFLEVYSPMPEKAVFASLGTHADRLQYQHHLDQKYRYPERIGLHHWDR